MEVQTYVSVNGLFVGVWSGNRCAMLGMKPWYRETPLKKGPCWVTAGTAKLKLLGHEGKEGMGAGGGMRGTASSYMDEGSGLKLACGRLQSEKRPLEACKWQRKSWNSFMGVSWGWRISGIYLRSSKRYCRAGLPTPSKSLSNPLSLAAFENYTIPKPARV